MKSFIFKHLIENVRMYFAKYVTGFIYYVNRLWDYTEEGSYISGLGNIVYCSLRVRVNCDSNAISVPTTVCSAKLQDWPIREAVRPRKIIRGVHKKGYRKWGSHAEGQLPHSLYPQHDNRKIERRVRERYQISEVGNLEKIKDGMNSEAHA